ncbi:MAG: hypothetical protein Ct9H300mP11_10170 [Chloroflexota bacterium]|nr:MAG: hypothetical protein Ct9H300mP11_10170 [Chloroflexota bacterium]
MVVNPRITCMQCPACMAGQDDLCRRESFLGSSINGSYAEYVVVPAVNAHLLGRQRLFRGSSGGSDYLPTCMEHAPPETTVATMADGISAIRFCRSWSCRHPSCKGCYWCSCYRHDKQCRKGGKAIELGADVVINYKKEDIRERVERLQIGRV